MPTIPMFGVESAFFHSELTARLFVTYEYIPDSTLGINGNEDWEKSLLWLDYTGGTPSGRVRYTYGGPIAYTHGALSFTGGCFDTFEDDTDNGLPTLELTYPSSWLEFVITVSVLYNNYYTDPVFGLTRSPKNYTAVGGGIIQPKYVNSMSGTDANQYVMEAENTYRFTSRVLSIAQGNPLAARTGFKAYLMGFLPFGLTYEYGDGTTESFTVSEYVDNDLSSPYYGNGILHTPPTPKVYAAGEHIDYPRVWVTDGYGQRMRPIYWDLYPTAEVVADTADLSVRFDLTIWDFENEFDSYDIGFGDGTYLLNQTATSLTHNYPAFDVDYHVQIDLRDRDTPHAYINSNHVFLTVRPEITEFDALVTRAGPILTASPESGNVQIYYSAGGTADRATRALVTGARDPSLSQDATGRVRMMVHTDDEWAMYESADEGETMVAL